MNKAVVPGTPAIPATPSHEIGHCTMCPNHLVEKDPDPFDSFCSDDVKIRCTLSKAGYRGNYQKEPYITVGCRPYNTSKEDEVPDWCPLIKQAEPTPVTT